MKKIKELLIKYREIITYVVAGVLTTLVNWVVYHIFCLVLENLISNNALLVGISNAIAWIISVIFAFVINKIWVFESKSWMPSIAVKEAIAFTGARAITGVIEEVSLVGIAAIPAVAHFAFEVFGFKLSGNLIAKIVVSIIVMILNYVFSKLIVFKNKKEK